MPRRSAPAISVLVVDDQRTFAEALALAIGLESGLKARVAWSGAEALQQVEEAEPDVVLLDLEMPGMGGAETIRRIIRVRPEARILVLSAHDDDLSKARAIEAGARGFVSKLAPLSEVPKLVRRAHRGEILMEAEESARLLRALRRRRHQEATERQRANRLTPRQTQILQLLADGVSVRDVALRLEITPSTLRTHLQNVLMRLGVHSRVEAIAIAMRHGKVKQQA